MCMNHGLLNRLLRRRGPALLQSLPVYAPFSPSTPLTRYLGYGRLESEPLPEVAVLFHEAELAD